MHQSCSKNHMCVLGWISRSHARNGNEIQTSGHRGSAIKIEKHGFLIPVNPNKRENHETWHGVMTWHQHAAVFFFGRLGTSVVTLQIGNTSIIETVGVLLTNYVPPRVPYLQIRPLCMLIGRRALWPLLATHLPPNVSINGVRAAVLRRGYVSHWTEI